MTMQNTRRDILKGGLAVAGLGALGIPEWALPALAQGETLVPFTDLPATAAPPAADRRLLDVRTIEAPLTPKDSFFTTQHYGHPDRRSGGLPAESVRAREQTVVALARRSSRDEDEPRSRSASSAPATAVPCRACAATAAGPACRSARCSIMPASRATRKEFVFFGADRGDEEVEFRTQKFTVNQQFGRSMPREKALSPEPLLAYAHERRTAHQAPGVPAQIDRPRMVRRRQREMAVRDSRPGGSVPRQVPGSLVPDAQRRDDQRRDEVDRGCRHEHAAQVLRRPGFARRRPHERARRHPQRRHADQVGGGQDRRRPLAGRRRSTRPRTSKYSWKLFNYTWTGATPGEHTLVSRVTDVTGLVQPTEKDLENKKTFLEDNSQYPRKRS